MPYKSEKIKLSAEQDKRRKLTDEQKEEIRRIYKQGKCGTRPIAKQYGVSRSLIQVIVNDDLAAKRKQYAKDHWRDNSQTKEERARAMRNYRHHKQELYLAGKLVEKPY